MPKASDQVTKDVFSGRERYLLGADYPTSTYESNIKIFNTVEASKNLPDGLSGQIKSLRSAYIALHNAYKNVADHELTVQRVDREASWRAFWFRVGTTAAIAILLGGIYTLAGNFDNIYLPLQHKTVVHYYDGKVQPTAPDMDKYEKTKTEVEVTGSTKGSVWRTTSPLPMP